MPYCPSCQSEYRPGFDRCAHCEVPLVHERPEAGEDKAERLRQAVASGQGVRIARSTYAEACQMVEMLHGAGIDSMVTGDPETCGKGGQCSHYFVTVLEEDVAAAAQVLREEFRRLVALDPECAQADTEALVDFDAEGQKSCPACGASFEGRPEECPDCGLFLGVG